MLPTHDIPAVRCEAAAPGVEVAVGGVACMDSMGPPRRVERRVGAFTSRVTGGHGDPRWAGKKAGPLRMACGLGAMSTGRRGCDTGFDSSVTLFPHAPVAQLVEPVRSIRMLRGLHGLCDRANLVGLAAWVGRSNRPGRNFPFREATK